jgi:hypothetical protein
MANTPGISGSSRPSMTVRCTVRKRTIASAAVRRIVEVID